MTDTEGAYDSEAEYARQYWAWVDAVEAEWTETALGSVDTEHWDPEDDGWS